MSHPRDERAPDDGQHEDWLTDLTGPDRPVRPGVARGGLRDQGGSLRGGGLRQRPAPTPTLDSARVRSARSIVAPKRAGPAEEAEEAGAAEEEPTAARKAVAAQRRAPGGAGARKPAAAVPQFKMPALPKVNLPSVKVSAEDVRKLAARRPKLHRPALHRPRWRLSPRQTAALGIGLAALLATVSGLATVVPNKPVVDPGTGAVNNVEFTAAAAPPDTVFNFGPFFVPTEGRLLMMGSDGQTSFVWASTDGSNWERYTSADAFGGPDHRFVALGFAADGNGGYVAVGDSFDAAGNVSASAWYSRDAKKWFAASVDFPESAEMMGLAVGSEAMISAGNGVAWVSRGGTSWRMVALPEATGYVPRAVRTWAGGYAIVSAWAGDGDRKSAVWVSPDGETWLQGWSMLTLFDVEDAVAYGSGLVAVGSQGRTVDELATPSPTPEPSASAKVTPKATKTPEPTPDTSGSPGTSMEPTPTPLPTTAAIAYQIAGSWSSANGLEWFKGNSLGGPYAQSMTSVAQAFDSLVAVGSSPGDLRGTDSAGEGNLTLWVTDDGNAWKPIRTNVPTLSRSRIVQYGRYLVLAGVGPNGKLTVLAGEVSLGAPLPPVFASPTPAIALSVRADESPAIPGLKGVDTLGPVIAVGDRFYFFINQATGTGIWTSTDGRSPLTAQAEPADLLPAEGAEGSIPTVLDAIADGDGGILAVGKITAEGEDKAAIWRLSGETWTQVPITGSAPAALGSLSQRNGTFVAAATVAEGPRIMVSEDGGSWVEASVPGSSGYILGITTWSGGFVASGKPGAAAAKDEDDIDAEPTATASPGTVHVWTSADGLVWTAQADWQLPRNPGHVIGAGDGLVIASTGITGKDSWWWSADGKAWQEAQLTTPAGGCMARLDTGLIKVAPPAPEAEDPAWHIWVSEDGQSWQNPGIYNVAFEDTTVCRVASSGKKIAIVGWASPSVLRVYISR